MMKTLLVSISLILLVSFLTFNKVYSDEKFCNNTDGKYCINIHVVTLAMLKDQKNDLCFVVQLNGSDQASGSIPMQQLPTVLFSITKDRASYGKPLNFKLVKAQVVPTGQCNVMQAKLQPVMNCDIMEYSVAGGTARSMTISESKDHAFFTCKVK